MTAQCARNYYHLSPHRRAHVLCAPPRARYVFLSKGTRTVPFAKPSHARTCYLVLLSCSGAFCSNRDALLEQEKAKTRVLKTCRADARAHCSTRDDPRCRWVSFTYSFWSLLGLHTDVEGGPQSSFRSAVWGPIQKVFSSFCQ